MTTPTNPLLRALEPGQDLIPFADVRATHVTPALDQVLRECDAALEQAVSAAVPARYHDLAAVLDVAVERLRRTWGAVVHLQAVADTPELRAAHADNLGRVTDFYTRLASDARLYAKYKSVAAAPAAAALTPAQRKALADSLRDFVLGGAELQGAARERFAAIQARMAELSQSFGDRVLDATDAFALYVAPTELDGVPADVVAAAQAAAAADGQPAGLCKLTLQIPCYLPVVTYATRRELRERLFRAYMGRASELGASEHDNSATMRELVHLRHECAALLGHASYAHLSLVPKMARSPQEVLGFVRDLAARAQAPAKAEDAELRRFAAAELGLTDMQPWDRFFVAERLKQQRYAFSSDEVKQFFPLPHVLSGLFRLIETLFGVVIRPEAASTWHPDVQFFRVWRGAEPVAGVYLDLYARTGKQSGAWMDDCRQRWARPDGRLQLPVAHLVCNFAPPVGERPALLTHDDLVTLFHEFGHGLHHMLTRVDELAVSGIAGVEWDACELPSQFMENFCWEWEVLRRLSANVASGEPMPRALFDRLRAARNFGSGLTMVRHCEYGLFDMRLHLEPAQAERITELAFEVAAELSPVQPAPFARYPHSFGHLFDGSYAAGYYSYAWAEVLSADAYEAFEQPDADTAATGTRFREAILEVGGSRPALESFRAFRGREPRIDALLRHHGLA
jgi:oligopeptidase A